MASLRASDRVVATCLAGEVVTIDGFLSAGECQLALDELELAVWQPSMVYVRHDDGAYRDVMSPLRVSETAQQRWFADPLQQLLASAERRLGTLFDVDPLDLETWQATTYPYRGTFYYHLDAGYWNDHYAGDRILTFLLYLTTPSRGGGTHFRALDVSVEAKAGRLLVFNNLFPHGGADHRMIHSSVPLLEGNKTTLVTWQRQRRYRTWLKPTDTASSSRKSRSGTARRSISRSRPAF